MKQTGKNGARTACGIFLALLLLTLWLLEAAVRQADALLPDAYEFSSADGLGFPFAALAASEDSAQTALTALAEKGVYTVRYGDKAQRLRLLYTQGDAARVLGLRMVRGAFLPAQALAPEENHAVVIDAVLAQEFFFTPECVGRTLEADGAVYTVCGVYEAAEGFFPGVCGDGLSAAFLPAALADAHTQPVAHVFYRSADAHFPDAARDAVAALAGQQPAAAYLGDHAETKAFLRQCVRLVCVLMSAAVCLAALALLAGAGRPRPRGGVSLRRGRLAGGALLLALGVFGWRACAFSLSLPAAWTPPDNIFDVSFYLEKYADAWQAVHSGLTDFYLNRCTLCALGVCACLTLLCAVWVVCAAAAGLWLCRARPLPADKA